MSYTVKYLLATFVAFIITVNLILRFPYSIRTPTILSPPDKPKPRLHLTSKNTFNIAIFSDLHYGEAESSFGPEQDRNSTEVIRKILDFEEPDFVVINGDLISGEKTYLENSTKYVDQIVAPMVEKNYPWASTYGNHDTQYNLSREALFIEESKFDLSYTQHSIKGVGGVTNYWLPIYASSSSSSTSEDSPVAILWFFDSLGGENFQRSWLLRWMPNWVVSTAVSWFETQRDIIETRWGVLPSLAFVHIPPTSFLKFAQQKLPGKGDKDVHFPGLNDDVPIDPQGFGRWWDRDKPFVTALLATKGLHSVYSGHDHGDSWCGTGDGSPSNDGEMAPFFCFVKHTGYGGYGTWNRGSRVVGLKFGLEDRTELRRTGVSGIGMEVETWVRMESGNVIQRVGLNETYGIDVYPVDDGE